MRHPERRQLPLFAVLLALAFNAQAGSVSFVSPHKQVAFLELFTSEGCSSCPPAEAWLSALKGSAGLWKEFVPAAFHVNYWDYLGWRDPWSSRAFSDRQHDYAQLWRRDSVYTPGFVLNGKEWRGWSKLARGPNSSTARVGVLKADSTDLRHWQVSFTPASGSDAAYEAHCALLVSGLTSDVKAGENRGRRLAHDFVVVALAHQPLSKQGPQVRAEVPLSPSQSQGASPLAVAIWVTRLHGLEPLQATGGWLGNRSTAAGETVRSSEAPASPQPERGSQQPRIDPAQQSRE